MLFHAQHDVLEVECGDVTASVWILELKCLKCTFLVKVVEELREFCVADGACPVAPEVKFCKRSVKLEGNFHVKFRLFDDRREFS